VPPSCRGDGVRREGIRRLFLLGTASLLAAGSAGALWGLTAHAQQTFNVVTYGADPTGVKDSTLQVQSAIDAAQAAGSGNVVYFPTGNYVFFKKISAGDSLSVNGSSAVTLQGDGASASVLIEGVGKNLLAVNTDGTVVTGLKLDAQPNAMTSHAQAALVMAASNTLLENSTILGGPNSFAVFYPGPPGATKSNIIYDTGNNIDNISIDDQWNRDGFSYSFQENGLVQNVTHTGSRMAIFVDKNIEVDNYTYHPGAQTRSTQGFWITAPSDGVTINGFDTYGNGGTIGSGGSPSTNITIKNETYHNGGGFHLTVGEVKGLTVDTCNFGTNNELRFIDNHQATGVLVENCSSLPVVRFAQPARQPGTVQATFANNTYPAFTPIPQQGQQTFMNINGAPTDFTVNGGTFQNCSEGLFKGSNTTFAVNNLSGYPCSADAIPTPALSLSPQWCNAPCTVKANASASTDTDSTPIVDYQFTWGDGTSTPRQPASSVTHSYNKAGIYRVSVDVIDSAGLNASTHQRATIKVHNLVGNSGFKCDCTTGWAPGSGSAMSLATTAHSLPYAAQVARTASAGRAQLHDSPAWNSDTQAGTTCHVSAWVEAPTGLGVSLRTLEMNGTTIVAKHTFSVVDSSGGWVQVSGASPIAAPGDVLQLQIYARLNLGQVLLIDDLVESCQ
jgi:Pectate lyase superfamily protein/PKD domain